MRHLPVVLVGLLCAAAWAFVVLEAGPGLLTYLIPIAMAGWLVAIYEIRARRQKRRAVTDTEAEHGRAAALRVEAALCLWDDQRLAAIYAEFAELEGETEADQLRSHVEESRSHSPVLTRPVRSWRALAIAIPTFAIVMLASVLIARL